MSYYSRMCQTENRPLTTGKKENTVLIILEFKKKKRKATWCHSRNKTESQRVKTVDRHLRYFFHSYSKCSL